MKHDIALYCTDCTTDETSTLKAGFHFGEFPGEFSVARPSNALSGHAVLEIQAESERSLANARPVLEVESSSTFLRPELATANQIASFQC